MTEGEIYDAIVYLINNRIATFKEIHEKLYTKFGVKNIALETVKDLKHKARIPNELKEALKNITKDEFLETFKKVIKNNLNLNNLHFEVAVTEFFLHTEEEMKNNPNLFKEIVEKWYPKDITKKDITKVNVLLKNKLSRMGYSVNNKYPSWFIYYIEVFSNKPSAYEYEIALRNKEREEAGIPQVIETIKRNSVLDKLLKKKKEAE